MHNSEPLPAPEHLAEPGLLQQQAARIEALAVLGRTGQLPRLFEFLVQCGRENRTPKEIEIATAVFGRDTSFDSSQDAAVRVYMHKLRKRLDAHYAGAGAAEPWRLSLPKGEYRLQLSPQLEAVAMAPATPDMQTGTDGPVDAPPRWPAEADDLDAKLPAVPALPAPATAPAPTRRRWLRAALGVSLGANGVLAAALALQSRDGPDPELRQLRASPLWSPLLLGDRPVVIVVGDYFLVGDTEGGVQMQRLVREFDLQSADDLARLQSVPGNRASRYIDPHLSYLPTSAAAGLREVVPIVALPSKRLRVVLMSQLSTDMLGIAHVVYIGLLSGLGKLRSLVLAGSGFGFGKTDDELIDATSHQHYVSSADLPRPSQPKVRDYGYVSSFGGPSGNRFVVVSGMRDIGLQHSANLVGRWSKLQSLAGAPSAFEALHEAHGLNHTLLESSTVLVRPLDAQRIWRNTS